MPQHLFNLSISLKITISIFKKKSSISKPSIKFEAFEHKRNPTFKSRVASAVHGRHPGLYHLAISTSDNQTLGVSLSARSSSLRMYIFTQIHWLIDFYVKVHTYIYIMYVSIYVLCVTYITYWVWFDVISETPLIPQLCLALGILAIAPLQHTTYICYVIIVFDVLFGPTKICW